MSSSYCPVARPSDWYEPEPALEWRKAQRPRDEAQRKLALIDEIVSKALVSARTVSAELPLAVRFRELANRWERETSHVSSITKRVMHPCYQSILAMGPNVISLLIQDMRENRRDWFWALHHLTQENPVSLEDSGNLDKMIAAWVDWERKKRGE
jgi:hypothetical protein